jgi:hypothetical protein
LEQPQIEVEVLEKDLEVGGRYTLKVKILVPGEYESLSMALQDEEATVATLGTPRQTGPAEFTVEVRPRRRGDWSLRPEVKARLAGSTAETPLNSAPIVLSVKAPGAAPEAIPALTDPRSVPFDYTLRNLLLAAGALLILAALFGLAFLVRRMIAARRAKALYRPPVPPIEIALTRLGELATLSVFRQHGTDAHYTELSMAVRRYLEAMFGRPAVEMTEDEVVQWIEGDLSSFRGAKELPQVLLRSSMAKFARVAPSEDDARGDVERTFSFLRFEKERLDAEAKARAAQAATAEGRSA